MNRLICILCWAGLGLVAACGGAGENSGSALDRAEARAADAPRIMPPAREDSLLAVESGLPVNERIGRWARRYLAADGVAYLFGLAEGGYAAEGDLVQRSTEAYIVHHADFMSYLPFKNPANLAKS